jgi:hypothetical protein
MTSLALFDQKISMLDVSITPGTKMTYSGLLMDHQKFSILLIFGTFYLEAVEEKDVIFFQIKGSEVILRIPKPPSNKIYLAYLYPSKQIKT